MNEKVNVHIPYGPYEKFFKRPFDFFCSLMALIVLSPLLIILTAVGAVAMRGNPFFAQRRPGKIGHDGKEKIFKLIKFRTMSNKKDAEGNLLPDAERLNRYGRILRALSLDELPELINILKGDLSVVGPRPLLVNYLPYYTEEERRRHDVRPGLTGLSQVHGRNYSAWEERFAYDISYVDKITFFGDIKIILNSVKVVLMHDGVADRSQIYEDANGDLYIKIDGVEHKYPKPLDVERRSVEVNV